MRNDLYVKVMLTVIALLLGYIAFRPMFEHDEPTTFAPVIGRGTGSSGGPR